MCVCACACVWECVRASERLCLSLNVYALYITLHLFMSYTSHLANVFCWKYDYKQSLSYLILSYRVEPRENYLMYHIAAMYFL